MIYGLIGKTLGHSRSPEIHKNIFKLTDDGTSSYSLFPLASHELHRFTKKIRSGKIDGINVTLPYKLDIIKHLDTVSDEAKEIGAVNTVVRSSDGKLAGYNTDYIGFKKLLQFYNIGVKGKKVFVLGSGGAAKAIVLCVKKLGGFVTIVSRDPKNAAEKFDGYNCDSYDELDLSSEDIIINTTPLGMYPNTDASPLPEEMVAKCGCVVDIVYNPKETTLISFAKKHRVKAVNGLYMLTAQAVAAQEIFKGKSIDPKVYSSVYFMAALAGRNIVLTGMPGCGKSTVAKVLSGKTSLPYVDMDSRIESKYGSIPKLFAISEQHFRDIETAVCREVSACSDTIISTGGGAVLREENVLCLKENGVIIFIDRHPDEIAGQIRVSHRPLLANDKSKIYTLFQQRYEIYKQTSDYIIDGNPSIDSIVFDIIDIINRI